MKRVLCALVCFAVAGCSREHPAAPRPVGKVFFEGKGPEREVKRFGMLLNVALDDFDLARADTRDAADARVIAEFKEEELTTYLYSPVVRVGFASGKSGQYALLSCNIVSTSEKVFEEEVTRIAFPESWKSEHSTMSTVYIGEDGFKDSRKLLGVLRTSLPEAGYRVVASPAEADTELKSIGMVRLTVPMKTKVYSWSYEILDRDGKRFFWSSGSRDLVYLGSDKSIKLSNLPCESTFVTFGRDSRRGASWTGAVNMARTIREHFNETATKNH